MRGKRGHILILGGARSGKSAHALDVAASIDPTVLEGGDVTVIPAAAPAIAASVDPTIILGSITLTPDVAWAIAASVDPVTLAGSLTLSPSAASAIAAAVDPTVTLIGSATITPAAAWAIAAAVDPTVIVPTAALGDQTVRLRVSGTELIIETTSDLSGFTGWVAGEYTKS